MIKINLLPKGINEKKIIKALMMLFGILFVAIIVGAFAIRMLVIDPKIERKQMELKQAQAYKAQVEANKAQTAKINGQVADITAKLNFINAVLKYNTQYPELYKKVAMWTYEKIVLDSLTSNGTNVTMTARAKNLRDLGRYILNLYRANDLYTQVSISGVPGYPAILSASAAPTASSGVAGIGAIQTSLQRAPATETTLTFSVTCVLKTPIVAPRFTAAGAAAAPAGGPGSPAPGVPPLP